MKKKNFKTVFFSYKFILLIILIIGIIGTAFAFTTATDARLFSFQTDSNVKLELCERVNEKAYLQDEKTINVDTKVIPNISIDIAPYVKNTGGCNTYVYILVECPCYEINETQEDYFVLNGLTESWSYCSEINRKEIDGKENCRYYLYLYNNVLKKGEETEDFVTYIVTTDFPDAKTIRMLNNELIITQENPIVDNKLSLNLSVYGLSAQENTNLNISNRTSVFLKNFVDLDGGFIE